MVHQSSRLCDAHADGIRFCVYQLYLSGTASFDPLAADLRVWKRNSLRPHQFQMEQSCQPQCRRSEEHTSELQSLMRISYAVFCLKHKHEQQIKLQPQTHNTTRNTT